MIFLKISLVGTPFPLNFLCGNAVPMRSRPTTPLVRIAFKLVFFVTIQLSRSYTNVHFPAKLQEKITHLVFIP